MSLARAQSSGKRAQALLAGMATHSVLSLEAPEPQPPLVPRVSAPELAYSIAPGELVLNPRFIEGEYNQPVVPRLDLRRHPQYKQVAELNSHSMSASGGFRIWDGICSRPFIWAVLLSELSERGTKRRVRDLNQSPVRGVHLQDQ